MAYADATQLNTQAYDAASLPGTSWKANIASPSTGNATDNKWDDRTPYANGGNILSSNNLASPTENAPLIRTTIGNLRPGQTYDVFSYFWSSDSANWRMKASLNAGDINNNGTPATRADDSLPTSANVAFAANAATGWTDAPTIIELGIATTTTTAGLVSGAAQGYFASNVLVREGDRSLYQATLGTAVADANGQIRVYVDDNANGGQPNRTWYDGLGVRQSRQAPVAGITSLPAAATSRWAPARRLNWTYTTGRTSSAWPSQATRRWADSSRSRFSTRANSRSATPPG